MKVWKNQIIGLALGLFLGGAFAPSLEFLAVIVVFITVISIIFRRNIMKGPLWGFVIGLLVGYSFRPYLTGWPFLS